MHGLGEGIRKMIKASSHVTPGSWALRKGATTSLGATAPVAALKLTAQKSRDPSGRSGSVSRHLPQQDSKPSLSDKSASKGGRPFGRKAPTRLKLSIVKGRYGSAVDNRLGDTDAGNTEEADHADRDA